MSTVFSPSKARVTPATPVKKQEPKLRIVYGAPFRPPRMPFVIFVVSLLAAGLVGLLLLNTELQRGTFQVTALNQQADQLRDQQEQLERQVRTLESPQNLADRSLRMGMVPNPNPVFLRLSDGRVLGVPAEGKAGTGATMFGPGLPTQPATPKPPAVTPPPAGTTPPAGTRVTPPASTAVTPPASTAVTPPAAANTKPPATASTRPPAPTSTKPPAARTTKPPATTTGTNAPTGG